MASFNKKKPLLGKGFSHSVLMSSIIRLYPFLGHRARLHPANCLLLPLQDCRKHQLVTSTKSKVFIFILWFVIWVIFFAELLLTMALTLLHLKSPRYSLRFHQSKHYLFQRSQVLLLEKALSLPRQGFLLPLFLQLQLKPYSSHDIFE